MDRQAEALQQRLAQLLRAAAEVSVALDRAKGTIQGVPHSAVIELRAHDLGRQLSRLIQQRHRTTLVAQQAPRAAGPGCGTSCPVSCTPTNARSPRATGRSRGPNSEAMARDVGGRLSPLRGPLGFDARPLTPVSVHRLIRTAAEARSFARAALVRDESVAAPVAAKTIERVVHDVGGELAERRDADPRSDDALAPRCVSPPQLAVVACDGGRIRTRAPGHGPGVHRTGGGGGREDKNACLIRATPTVSAEDPQPEPPACVCDPKHLATIAATEALSVAAAVPRDGTPEPEGDDPPPVAPAPSAAWPPQRLVRTVLSGRADSQAFGGQMARAAQRRRFFEAPAKAFLGEGLPWNGSIWKNHSSAFTPILDFIHVLSYRFVAAQAVHGAAEDAWGQDVVWMCGCWQGAVAQVREELRHWQAKLGSPPEDAAETDPRAIVVKTITDLENNEPRMNYPEYRRHGLPMTTAWRES